MAPPVIKGADFGPLPHSLASKGTGTQRISVRKKLVCDVHNDTDRQCRMILRNSGRLSCRESESSRVASCMSTWLQHNAIPVRLELPIMVGSLSC